MASRVFYMYNFIVLFVSLIFFSWGSVSWGGTLALLRAFVVVVVVVIGPYMVDAIRVVSYH